MLCRVNLRCLISPLFCGDGSLSVCSGASEEVVDDRPSLSEHGEVEAVLSGYKHKGILLILVTHRPTANQQKHVLG